MAETPASVDYARDVKPLLAKHCVSCHGATSPRAASGSTPAGRRDQGRGDGPGGRPRQERREPADPGRHRRRRRRAHAAEAAAPLGRADRDPPGLDRPGGHGPGRRDARAGARRRTGPSSRPDGPAAPTVDDPAGSATRSTASSCARLEREGLAPSPEADRATLIRRLSLDLTGLPPTPDEVDAFLADDRPDAYERLVDRLLASPHYGERWARHWLDLARYADSNGYSIDAPRSIWQYRDWVIDALNRDLPFDQFTDRAARRRPAARTPRSSRRSPPASTATR